MSDIVEECPKKEGYFFIYDARLIIFCIVLLTTITMPRFSKLAILMHLAGKNKKLAVL